MFNIFLLVTIIRKYIPNFRNLKNEEELVIVVKHNYSLPIPLPSFMREVELILGELFDVC